MAAARLRAQATRRRAGVQLLTLPDYYGLRFEGFGLLLDLSLGFDMARKKGTVVHFAVQCRYYIVVYLDLEGLSSVFIIILSSPYASH